MRFRQALPPPSETRGPVMRTGPAPSVRAVTRAANRFSPHGRGLHGKHGGGGLGAPHLPDAPGPRGDPSPPAKGRPSPAPGPALRTGAAAVGPSGATGMRPGAAGQGRRLTYLRRRLLRPLPARPPCCCDARFRLAPRASWGPGPGPAGRNGDAASEAGPVAGPAPPRGENNKLP